MYFFKNTSVNLKYSVNLQMSLIFSDYFLKMHSKCVNLQMSLIFTDYFFKNASVNLKLSENLHM